MIGTQELKTALEMSMDEGYGMLVEFIRSKNAPATPPENADRSAEWFRDHYQPDADLESLFSEWVDYLLYVWSQHSDGDRATGIWNLCHLLGEAGADQGIPAVEQPATGAVAGEDHSEPHQLVVSSPIAAGTEFTAPEQEKIIAARKMAIAAAVHAANVLKASFQTDGLFGIKWFGTAWEARYNHIIDIYSKIAGEAGEVPVARYGTGGSQKVVSGAAGGHSYLYTDLGTSIYVFDQFWELNSEQQGFFFLHEMSHWVDEHVLDRSSMGRDEALSLARTKRDGTPNAVYNAYSFHYCAEDAWNHG